ncbi:hypothetical protein Tcan_04726 [Toxocara canis]|uniref:Uncharacterized protein n=1 Tax=Toxocara canis TaxID=6265 RepID=A0A0B2V4L4_TOXCA|nr:hypothetical protein Tcan_04726 [Toxocara canis]
MENGVVIEFSPEEQPSREGTNRVPSGRTLFVEQLPEDVSKKSDASVNAKLQFLWNNLNEREQQVTQEIRHRICEQHNRLLLLIEALSRTDPTTAARILLKRVDIAAENIGDLLKVYPCKRLEVSEVFVNHKVQNKCYRNLPVRYKDEILFVHPRSREIKTTSEVINCGAVRTKQDRRIVEEWTRETEKEESIFDAPPLPDISEERLQWVLGMIEKNHQTWEQSAEENEKSMVDSVRDDAEEIIEAASEAIEKSLRNTTMCKEKQKGMSELDCLYKDKYCKLTKSKLRIRTYYFPTGQDKVIRIEKIRLVYCKKQVLSEDLWKVKGWGMSLSPIWWACDLARELHSPKADHYNVVIDTGSCTNKGFTVANCNEFIRQLQKLLSPEKFVPGELPS